MWGVVVGCFGMGLGRWRGGRTKIENHVFQKYLGVFFPRRGHQNKRFGHTPGPKKTKISNLDFWYFGVGGMGEAIKSAAPRMGERSVIKIGGSSLHYLQNLQNEGLAGTRPYRRPLPQILKKSIKNPPSKKHHFLSPNGAPSGPKGLPKITKICKSASQEGTFDAF